MDVPLGSWTKPLNVQAAVRSLDPVENDLADFFVDKRVALMWAHVSEHVARVLLGRCDPDHVRRRRLEIIDVERYGTEIE